MSDAANFVIDPEFGERIFWSRRGSCGNAGCKDPECCCSLCARPIGVQDEDPRWDQHDEHCDDCDLCRDRIPIILFHGEGEAMKQAQFHVQCFESMLIPMANERTTRPNLSDSPNSTPKES